MRFVLRGAVLRVEQVVDEQLRGDRMWRAREGGDGVGALHAAFLGDVVGEVRDRLPGSRSGRRPRCDRSTRRPRSSSRSCRSSRSRTSGFCCLSRASAASSWAVSVGVGGVPELDQRQPEDLLPVVEHRDVLAPALIPERLRAGRLLLDRAPGRSRRPSSTTCTGPCTGCPGRSPGRPTPRRGCRCS